jgi:hypothetical protein
MFIFAIYFKFHYAPRLPKQYLSYIYFKEFLNQFNLIYFSYVYIYNRLRVMDTRVNVSHYELQPRTLWVEMI